MIGRIASKLGVWALAYAGTVILPKVASALEGAVADGANALPKVSNPPHLGKYIDIFV